MTEITTSLYLVISQVLMVAFACVLALAKQAPQPKRE